MTENNIELIEKLQAIEYALQQDRQSSAELRSVVNSLRSIVQSLDKDVAIQSEKISHLVYRIEQLQLELTAIEAKGDKNSDKHRQLVENALMAFLGGLITYVFSLIK